MARRTETTAQTPETTAEARQRGTLGNSRRAERTQRLHKARQTYLDQLAEQRRQEAEVEAALQEFVAATVNIDAAHDACQRKVDGLQQRIEQHWAELESATGDDRAARAAAALRMHEEGRRTVAEVRELCELPSDAAARELIAAGRRRSTGDASVAVTDASSSTAQTSSGETAETTEASDHPDAYDGDGGESSAAEPVPAWPGSPDTAQDKPARSRTMPDGHGAGK